MKHSVPFILILSFFWLGFQLYAQDEPVRRPYTLTHEMTPEEKANFHTVGKDFLATDPPPGEIRNIAEFDQMEGVLVTYPGSFGISYALIAAMSQETNVTTIVENNNQLNFVTGQYQNNGVNMENTSFFIAPLDSYWCRDYGPWYVTYGDDEIGIVDFIYNRPNRPNDNAVPSQMAGYLGIGFFAMDFIATGGNYMTDGYGISASTDLVWVENPTLTHEEIDQMVEAYIGIDTYHVLPDPNNTYIDHIDCWGKLLAEDKVLIREVPESHPQFDEIEAAANYFANQVSSWGNNYQVFRVWTPNNEPYTNSLILNDHVFVPIVGGQWDDEAIAVYQEAMPGYEILGFTGTWESTDALHCRTKGIANRNTLYIRHMPLLGDQPVQTSYTIDAQITAYSGADINSEDVLIHYTINGVVQDPVSMTSLGGKNYTANITAGPEGSEMTYYISAVDIDGNAGNHPIIGAPDPHIFYVGEQLFPAISLDVSEIDIATTQGNSATETFEISNTGQMELNYSIDFSSAILENYEYNVDDSPSPGSWNSNTFTELGWTTFEVDNVVGEIANWSISFHWDTDQYSEESTFYALSPGGTQAIISAALPDGDYTINLDVFNGEQMQGTWKLWITDSYGDGGHQVSDILITITKTYTIFNWLSVEPISGTVDPGNAQTISVTANASVMPVGTYDGTITVNSTDPENSTIIIPVHFTIDVESGIADASNGNDVGISNYPNPFHESTIFEIFLPAETNVSLSLYDVRGRFIVNLLDEKLVKGNTQISWDGTGADQQQLPKGVYFYRLQSGKVLRTGKIILY